jgi:DNA-binding NarL/FixJ family response regulator
LANASDKPRSFMTDRETRRTPGPVSVLIVDDHPMFLDGLRMALELEEDIRVLGQCTDGEDALREASAQKPDVVLLDINLPSMNGLQVTRMLKAERDDIAVIVLTAYHDAEQVLHAMRAGASAYCAKDITPKELVEMIREVANGYYIVGTERMDSQMLHTWINLNVEAITGPYIIDPNEHYLPLSPREMEILQFVTHGLSNKEIASRLRISQQTVKNHMTSILKKLNVQDRTQAAVTALRHGWVRIQDSWDGNTANRV